MANGTEISGKVGGQQRKRNCQHCDQSGEPAVRLSGPEDEQDPEMRDHPRRRQSRQAFEEGDHRRSLADDATEAVIGDDRGDIGADQQRSERREAEADERRQHSRIVRRAAGEGDAERTERVLAVEETVTHGPGGEDFGDRRRDQDQRCHREDRPAMPTRDPAALVHDCSQRPGTKRRRQRHAADP